MAAADSGRDSPTDSFSPSGSRITRIITDYQHLVEQFDYSGGWR